MKKKLPWIIGMIFCVVYFAVFETLAFEHPDQYETLSHFVAAIGAAWPYAIFLFGFLAGGLSVHFFWSWKANPIEGGG